MASTAAAEPNSLRLNSGKLSPAAALMTRWAQRLTRYFSSPATRYRLAGEPSASWRFSSVSVMAAMSILPPYLDLAPAGQVQAKAALLRRLGVGAGGEHLPLGQHFLYYSIALQNSK